jgi:hypothetical protein
MKTYMYMNTILFVFNMSATFHWLTKYYTLSLSLFSDRLLSVVRLSVNFYGDRPAGATKEKNHFYICAFGKFFENYLITNLRASKVQVYNEAS